MEGIHPINSFKAMSTKQKAAAIAGTVAATAAIASVPLAYVKGKQGGEKEVLKAIGAGYKKMGNTVVDKFNKIKSNIVKPKTTQEAVEKTTEAAQETIEKTAGEAQPAVQKTAQTVEEKVSSTIETGLGVKFADKKAPKQPKKIKMEVL